MQISLHIKGICSPYSKSTPTEIGTMAFFEFYHLTYSTAGFQRSNLWSPCVCCPYIWSALVCNLFISCSVGMNAQVYHFFLEMSYKRLPTQAVFQWPSVLKQQKIDTNQLKVRLFSRPSHEVVKYLVGYWSKTVKNIENWTKTFAGPGCTHDLYHEYNNQGRIQGGTIGAIAPPKTYESSFIHHDFVHFGKQYSWYILQSIVLLQQCCEVYFISLTVVNPWWDLTTKYYWNSSPNFTGWIRP